MVLPLGLCTALIMFSVPNPSQGSLEGHCRLQDGGPRRPIVRLRLGFRTDGILRNPPLVRDACCSSDAMRPQAPKSLRLVDCLEGRQPQGKPSRWHATRRADLFEPCAQPDALEVDQKPHYVRLVHQATQSDLLGSAALLPASTCAASSAAQPSTAAMNARREQRPSALTGPANGAAADFLTGGCQMGLWSGVPHCFNTRFPVSCRSRSASAGHQPSLKRRT